MPEARRAGACGRRSRDIRVFRNSAPDRAKLEALKTSHLKQRRTVMASALAKAKNPKYYIAFLTEELRIIAEILHSRSAA
ncbi:MAG: hypothetical protein ACREVL_01110 [Solimonas sp.]